MDDVRTKMIPEHYDDLFCLFFCFVVFLFVLLFVFYFFVFLFLFFFFFLFFVFLFFLKSLKSIHWCRFITTERFKQLAES